MGPVRAGNDHRDFRRRPIMTDSPTLIDLPITTEADLTSALEAVFRSADANDLPVERTWAMRNGEGQPDWEVLVHELAKQV